MSRDLRILITNLAAISATVGLTLALWSMGAQGLSALGLGPLFCFTWVSDK